MNEVGFCPFCGRIINKEFHYCPYCGTTCKDVEPFEILLEQSMEKLEELTVTQGIKRLEKMESRLKKLESELESFLAVYSP